MSNTEHKPCSCQAPKAPAMECTCPKPAPASGCAVHPGIVEAVRVEAIRVGTMGEPLEAIAENVSAASPSCLPYVRVTKDPEKFNACMARSRAFGRIDDSNKLYDFIKQDMTSEDQENLMVILFDTQLYVRGVDKVARGARDRVSVPVPDVLRLPMVMGATAYAIAHNHPSGVASPSEADERLTAALRKASEAVQVDLFDHIVVGSDGYYSFRANKWKRGGKVTKRK